MSDAPNNQVTPDRIYGWKAIADALGVSRAKAIELANPMRKFQLPVRFGVRGIYVLREQLEMWDAHYDTPYGLHSELKRAPQKQA